MPNPEPTKAQLKTFEQRARSLAERSSHDHSPVVVEFAGSPKAGKTTTIEIVEHFFKRMGFKVWAPTEGAAKRTPYHLKRDLVAFNTWTLNYAISEMLVAYYNVDHHDLVILDRGPFDSLAWMRLLKEKNELSQEELKIFEQFALHPRWSKLFAKIYLFKCDPDISLQREMASKLTQRPGTAMNPKMLGGLLQQYERLERELLTYPLKPVDTSKGTTPRSTSFEIAKELLSELEQRADAS